MKHWIRTAVAAAAFVAAGAAQASMWHFDAHLTGPAEVPPTDSPAMGLATLMYDDMGTADWADDMWAFSMSAFDLTGPVTAAHIHGAATPTETAPPRVDLMAAPFLTFANSNALLVGGHNLPAMMVPATPASDMNAGHPEMSFLDMLRGGLAYVNVHTAQHPAGEIRGQLLPVQAVPEPSTYALMLGGLGLLGFAARRRAQKR